MRTSRFTDEQIIGIVREYEAGEKLTDLRRHSQEASIHAGTAPGRVSRTSAEALPSLPMATKRDRLAESDFAAFVRFYRDLDRFGPADEPPIAASTRSSRGALARARGSSRRPGHRAGTNPWGSGTGRARKQLAGDCLPFGAVIACRRRASGTPVPVGRVAEVALDPMQVRVDPGAGGIGLVLLDDTMGSVPVALAEMPQRAERSVEAFRRRLADERGL